MRLTPDAMLIASAAILTAPALTLLFLAAHKWPAHGPRCAKCRYDLRGLPPSTPCPECNSTLIESPRPPPTRAERLALILLALNCLIPAAHVAISLVLRYV
jgi:hypothetical protein